MSELTIPECVARLRKALRTDALIDVSLVAAKHLPTVLDHLAAVEAENEANAALYVAAEEKIAALRTSLDSARAAALEEATAICDRHDDWRWLRETYPDRFPGAPCEAAEGAKLCAEAIRRAARGEEASR